MTLVLVTIFLVAVFLGMPLAFAFGIASLVAMLVFGPVTVASMAHGMFAGLSNFVLIAVPMFIFASAVMVSSGMALKIFELFGALLGRIRGGMAAAVVASCMFFAGVTGSTVADAAAVAMTTLPVARAIGYGRSFLAGLIAASGTFGILIPPSLTMIVYGAITGESVGKLFMAGLVPGLVIGGIMMLASAGVARRRGYGVVTAGPSHLPRLVWQSVPALIVPVIIIGGIYGGLFTATESAAVAGAYGLVVARASGLVGWRAIWEMFGEAAETSAQIMIIVAAALFVGTLMTYDRVPATLVAVLDSVHVTRWTFLVGVNVLYLLLGLILDGFSILMLTVPVLYPLLSPLGISPIHFAVIATVNIEIGTITPPMGVNLFALSSIARLPVGEVFRETLPFLAVLLGGLVLITFVPALSLWLPAMLR